MTWVYLSHFVLSATRKGLRRLPNITAAPTHSTNKLLENQHRETECAFNSMAIQILTPSFTQLLGYSFQYYQDVNSLDTPIPGHF